MRERMQLNRVVKAIVLKFEVKYCEILMYSKMDYNLFTKDLTGDR